jgi:hypothetical protein
MKRAFLLVCSIIVVLTTAQIIGNYRGKSKPVIESKPVTETITESKPVTESKPATKTITESKPKTELELDSFAEMACKENAKLVYTSAYLGVTDAKIGEKLREIRILNLMIENKKIKTASNNVLTQFDSGNMKETAYAMVRMHNTCVKANKTLIGVKAN